MKIKAVFFAFVALASAFGDAAEVKCKKCNDKGVIYKECETCRGTKYVWKCHAPQNRSYYSAIQPAVNTSGYCGYGSTYKPIHENCKGTRKRINCPDCVKGKSKNFSTGKIAVACPYCDGNGTLAGEYYVIRDARFITDSDREYVFLHMDRPGDNEGDPLSRAKIFKKRMDKEALEEFKTVYANSKVFETLEEMKTFMKNNRGVGPVSQNPTLYAVRNPDRVTSNDRRVVFEQLGESVVSYFGGNVVQRRFSAQDLEDFKMINPKCRVFQSLDELKEFMRTVQVVETGDDYPPPRRVVRRAEPAQPAVTVTPSAPSSNGGRQITMEELDARIKAEMEHEKEMIQRSLNNR